MSLVQNVLNAVSDAAAPPGKRDRSPNFPAIGLGRAMERAQQLYNRARRYEARLPEVASAWGLAAKSSATLQTAAALIAFGLAEDSGSGEARKIKISDLGWRILEDQRPGIREKGLAEAALRPKLIADYAEHWKAGRPDDNFCISELKIERGFTEEAAARFLRVFDETIQFASSSRPDKVVDRQAVSESVEQRQKLEDDQLPSTPLVKVGDYVQWTSGGIDQFRVPCRVIGFFDEDHAQVFARNTGVPVSELTVVDPPEAAVSPTPTEAARVDSSNSAWVQGENDFTVLQRGNRLQITADVDLEGIATLKEMLTDYESILRRLAGRKVN
jgi:hypothetical protein